MALIQKRGLPLLLVLLLVLGMIPSVSAAEITTEPTTEPAETTAPATEETKPPETTAPGQTVPTETFPVETEPAEKTITEETAPEEEMSLSLMSLDNEIATLADTEIVGKPNAFANLFLLNGGIDIPSFDHVQHKAHLPLYSVYLKDQPGYENNYYVAYCIEPGVELGNSGGHTGSSSTVGGMTDGTGALEKLSREQVEAMGVILMYGQREIARRADEESLRLGKLARHAATQVLIWEIASGWRSATPPYTRYDSTLYDAIVPPLECAVKVWGTKFYLDGIDDAYNDIVAQMQRHYTIPSFMTGSKSSAPSYELVADGNGKYSITLTDTNNILSQYTFTNTSELTFSVSGNKLTVTASGPISDTLIAPTKQVPNLDNQVFYVWEYKEQQKLMSCKTEPANNPLPAYFYVTAPELTSNLDLTKTTEDGKNLAGWKFGIYADSGCANLISGPHTTDSKGKISVTGLTAGTVYVKELGHQDSAINTLYSCDSKNPQKVVLAAGETAKVSFQNNLNTGNAKLIKQTNTGKNLSGWQIGLYFDAACANPVPGSPFTTGTDGTIAVTGLKPGTLYAKELPTDDPYWAFDTSVKEVKIVANQTATVTFTNIHYGKLNIRKTMDTEGPLDGWQFRVTDASGKEITGSPFTSDKNGEIHVGNILPGVYKIEELLPEDSLYYCKSENPQTVTVKAGETAEVTFTNALRPGKITVEKQDLNGEHLAGAKFLLEWSEDGSSWYPIQYSDSGNVVKGYCSNPDVVEGTLTTSESGIIEWGNLHPGLYYRITELEAPEGYVLLSEAAYEGKLPTDDVEVVLRVINSEAFTLPQTGSHSELFFLISRILCIGICGTMLLFSFRKKRKA